MKCPHCHSDVQPPLDEHLPYCDALEAQRRTPSPLPKTPELPESREYLAIGPHCWGVGRKVVEAVRNAKQNAPGPSILKGKTYTIRVREVPTGQWNLTPWGDLTAQGEIRFVEDRTVRVRR